MAFSSQYRQRNRSHCVYHGYHLGPTNYSTQSGSPKAFLQKRLQWKHSFPLGLRAWGAPPRVVAALGGGGGQLWLHLDAAVSTIIFQLRTPTISTSTLRRRWPVRARPIRSLLTKGLHYGVCTTVAAFSTVRSTTPLRLTSGGSVALKKRPFILLL